MNSVNYVKKNKIKNLEEQLIKNGVNEEILASIYEVSVNPLKSLRDVYFEIKKNEPYKNNYNSLEIKLIEKGINEKLIHGLKKSDNYMIILRNIYETMNQL